MKSRHQPSPSINYGRQQKGYHDACGDFHTDSKFNLLSPKGCAYLNLVKVSKLNFPSLQREKSHGSANAVNYRQTSRWSVGPRQSLKIPIILASGLYIPSDFLTPTSIPQTPTAARALVPKVLIRSPDRVQIRQSQIQRRSHRIFSEFVLKKSCNHGRRHSHARATSTYRRPSAVYVVPLWSRCAFHILDSRRSARREILAGPAP